MSLSCCSEVKLTGLEPVSIASKGGEKLTLSRTCPDAVGYEPSAASEAPLGYDPRSHRVVVNLEVHDPMLSRCRRGVTPATPWLRSDAKAAGSSQSYDRPFEIIEGCVFVLRFPGTPLR
jgi:hypothetical protein